MTTTAFGPRSGPKMAGDPAFRNKQRYEKATIFGSQLTNMSIGSWALEYFAADKCLPPDSAYLSGLLKRLEWSLFGCRFAAGEEAGS